MFDNVAVMLPYVRRGEMRAPAVTGPRRSPLVPDDVPTLRAVGLADAEIEGRFVLLGPPGMPKAVVRRLNRAANAVLSSPASVERSTTLGAEPLVGTQQDVTALVGGDTERWGRVIREGGIRAE